MSAICPLINEVAAIKRLTILRRRNHTWLPIQVRRDVPVQSPSLLMAHGMNTLSATTTAKNKIIPSTLSHINAAQAKAVSSWEVARSSEVVPGNRTGG